MKPLPQYCSDRLDPLPVEMLQCSVFTIAMQHLYKLLGSPKIGHRRVLSRYCPRAKVTEFVIIQTFFGSKNRNPQKHLGISRFRGILSTSQVLKKLAAIPPVTILFSS